MKIKNLSSIDQVPVEAFANNDGTYFTLYVNGVKRMIKASGNDRRDNLTINFDLVKQNCAGKAVPVNFKDKHFRHDIHASKQETIKAFEKLVDMIFAMEAAEIEVIEV